MQSARRVIAVEPGDSRDVRVATLELACGCVVTRAIAADRVLVLGEELRAIGKYSCPVGHPVRRPE